MTKEEWLEEHREKLQIETPFELVIKFPTQEDKEQFAAWMSEQGEQTWWIWEDNYSEHLLEFLYHDEDGNDQSDWIKAIRTTDDN